MWPLIPEQGIESAEGEVRPRRVENRISILENSVEEENGGPLIDGGDGSATPRVSAGDVAPNRVVDVDGDELSKEERGGGAAQWEKDEYTVMSGLRARLLMEAVERALHSKTPWSDLSVVAMAFARAGDQETAQYWFARAARLAQDPDDVGKASKAMREVVKSLVQAKYLKEASELINRIPDQGEKARAQSEMVRAFAGKGDFEEAREIVSTLADDAAKGVALRYIAEYEAKRLGFEEARRTIQSILKGDLRDDASSRVALILAGKGEGESAMVLVNQIGDERIRDLALTRIASLQSAGSGFSAESLMTLISDPFFRDSALRNLVSNELDRRNLGSAETVANRIKNANQRAKAYESLVMLQIRYGDVRGAFERAQRIRLEEPRFRALQAVAISYIKEAGVAAARNIANLIGDPEMRDKTYGKIAFRASQVGQSRQAEETAAYIRDSGERAMVLANIALTQAKYGDDQFARRLAGTVSKEIEVTQSVRESERATGLLAEVHAETGDSNAAFEVASSIDNSGVRDMTYQKIAVRFARSKELHLAEQSANLIERDLTRERALDSVAQVLAGGVSAADALDVASRLEGRRQQVRFLVSVAGRKS